jgi:GT2 family glycosyltransferase
VYGSITLESAETSKIGFGGGFEFPARGEAQSLVYNRYQGMELDEYQARVGERKVWDVNGCSMLIPLPVIEAHGFIDDSFFLYGEEIDYCLRLNQKGVPVVVVPGSVVVHGVGRSFTNSRLGLVRVYYTTRNQFLLFRQYPAFFRSKYKSMYNKASIRNLVIFFCTYAFAMSRQDRINHAAQYYENLGKMHGMLGIRGKYLKPEKYLTRTG